MLYNNMYISPDVSFHLEQGSTVVCLFTSRGQQYFGNITKRSSLDCVVAKKNNTELNWLLKPICLPAKINKYVDDVMSAVPTDQLPWLMIQPGLVPRQEAQTAWPSSGADADTYHGHEALRLRNQVDLCTVPLRLGHNQRAHGYRNALTGHAGG